MPGPNPFGSVRSSEGQVRVTKDANGLVQHIAARVAAPNPCHVADPSCASQILALLGPFEVMRAVVLVQGVGALEPEIGTGHLGTVLVHEPILGQHFDVTEMVEQPEQRLPERLRSSIGEFERVAEKRYAATASTPCLLQLAASARSVVQCSVHEADEVDQTELTCASQDRVGRRVEGDAVHEPGPGQEYLPDAHDSCSPRPGLVLVDGGDHGQAGRDRREPPAVDPGCGEMGEPGR